MEKREQKKQTRNERKRYPFRRLKQEFQALTAPRPKKLLLITCYVIAASIACAIVISGLDQGVGQFVELMLK